MTFDSVWHHIKAHGEEIVWAVGLAAFFGILFAVIFDLLSPDSRVRAGIRHYKNQMAEQSVRLLIQRIQQLEQYKKLLADTRWQYLYALQLIFLILFSFCLGSALWVMSTTVLFRIYPDTVEMLGRFSICCFGLGVGFSVIGVSHVGRDTGEKMQAVVHKIEREIEGLQKTLKARLPHDVG
ncbi:MAG TPA: hypothetical protein VK578_10400 [Edaphobacter sp.]|nr:hypothetical protein [Edaphobacter sp.]